MSRVSINETTLTAIGDAIRGKTGKSDLIAPGDMPAEITGIVSGGADPVIEELEITANGTYNAYDGVDGFAPVVVNVPQDGAPTAEELTLTGNIQQAFYGDTWVWFIDKYGNQMTTKDITVTYSAFESYGSYYIPFEINCADTMYGSCASMFAQSQLKEMPMVNNLCPGATGDAKRLFYMNQQLRYFPEGFGDNWNFEAVNSATRQRDCSQWFYYCCSLRKLPMGVFGGSNPVVSTSSYSIYYQMCNNCYALDEIIDLPIFHTGVAQMNNMFNRSFDNCHRLQNLTFAPSEPVQWVNQVIDLTEKVGYSTTDAPIVNYNSGITKAKSVSNPEEYEALKNDPDWYAYLPAYSRYNHDSAVATINSLPDTSAYLAEAGGTNTIKFRSDAATAPVILGGAIRDLTEAEIAVAAAKGWTVTLV